MTNVLFIYSKVHCSVSYRQGMHELLAPLLAAIDVDSVDMIHADPYCLASQTPIMKVIFEILDRRFIEHDTYALFDHLMQTCAPWYHVPQESRERLPRIGTHRKPAISTKQEVERLDMIRQHEIERSIPIVAKCHKLFQNKLSRIDPELTDRIKELKIEPQLFGIRWFRLLFSREITDRENMFALWDCLFADKTNGPLDLAEWVALVMLLAIRNELVTGDYTDCLKKLLNFPKLPLPSYRSLKDAPSLPRNLPNSPTKDNSGSLAHISTPFNLPSLNNPALLLAQRLAIQAVSLRSCPFPSMAERITQQWDHWAGRITIPTDTDEQSSGESDSFVRRRAQTLPDMDDLDGDRASVYSDPLATLSRSIYAVPIRSQPSHHHNGSLMKFHTRSPSGRRRNQQRKHYTGTNIRQQNSNTNSPRLVANYHYQPIPASPLSSSPCGSDSVYSIMPNIKPISHQAMQGNNHTLIKHNEALISLGSLTEKALANTIRFLSKVTSDTEKNSGDSISTPSVSVDQQSFQNLMAMLSELTESWQTTLTDINHPLHSRPVSSSSPNTPKHNDILSKPLTKCPGAHTILEHMSKLELIDHDSGTDDHVSSITPLPHDITSNLSSSLRPHSDVIPSSPLHSSLYSKASTQQSSLLTTSRQPLSRNTSHRLAEQET